MTTVGEVREAFAGLLGIPREHIGHYAAVIDTPDGLVLKFCCDDRQYTADLLRLGAQALLTQPGEPMSGGRVPPMPTS